MVSEGLSSPHGIRAGISERVEALNRQYLLIPY